MPIIVDDELALGSGLQLRAVWLNSASDPADLCAFDYAGDSITIATRSRAEVRQLAGRRRVVRRGGRTYEAFTVGFEDCTPDQVEWLKDHVGVLLCVRDFVGSKVYAVYTETPREIDCGRRFRTDVKISLDEIDHSESV
jgi:hypothetical protein